jgi:hypothetical protein
MHCSGDIATPANQVTKPKYLYADSNDTDSRVLRKVGPEYNQGHKNEHHSSHNYRSVRVLTFRP